MKKIFRLLGTVIFGIGIMASTLTTFSQQHYYSLTPAPELGANMKYIAPGTNVVSNAVKAMTDGDTFVLGNGAYIQTEPITIPNGKLYIGISGQGSELTLINFRGCNGIRQANVNDKMRSFHLRGLTMTTDAAGIYTGIAFQGESRNVYANPSIALQDLQLRGSFGSYGWKVGIDAMHWWNFEVQDVDIRGHGRSSGIGMIFRSCVNGDIRGGEVGEVYLAFDIGMGSEYAHGSEGIDFNHTLVIEATSGVYLGPNALYISFTGCMFDFMYGTIIEEDRLSLGHHSFNGGWYAHAQSALAYSHTLLLSAEGSIVRGITWTGANTNGITLQERANASIIASNILRNADTAIWLLGVSGCVVEGNVIKEPSRNQRWDILLDAGTRSNLLSANSMRLGIENRGTNNQQYNNIIW